MGCCLHRSTASLACPDHARRAAARTVALLHSLLAPASLAARTVTLLHSLALTTLDGLLLAMLHTRPTTSLAQPVCLTGDARHNGRLEVH